MARNVPRSCLEDLPSDVIERIVLLLPDPSPLASTSHALAALLGEGELQLAWWDKHRPRRLRRANDSAEKLDTACFRHVGYALFYWRRVHCLGPPHLASLLLRLAELHDKTFKCSPAACSAAQQLMASAQPIHAVQALLPHADQLLLPYAAHAGHAQLLGSLLAALSSAQQQPQVQLQWGDQRASACLLETAARCAIRGGSVEALHLLLGALRSRGQLSDDLLVDLLEFAVEHDCNNSSTGCVLSLLQMAPRMYLTPDEEQECSMLARAVHTGCTGAVAVLASCSAVPASTRWAATRAAVEAGHGHMLRLLQPAMTEQLKIDMAVDICWGPVTQDWSTLAPVVPAAMWALRQYPIAHQAWAVCLRKTLASDKVALLGDVWKTFAASEYRAPLCSALLEALGTGWAAPWDTITHPIMARWLVDNAMPGLRAAAKAVGGRELRRKARREAFKHGHLELCEALNPTAAPFSTARADTSHPWHSEQRQGRLLHAVHRGDVAAVHTALEAPGSGASLRVALLSTQFIEDADAAEAVVRVLAAAWVDPTADDMMSLVDDSGLAVAHGGRLLRVLCELDPSTTTNVSGVAGQRFPAPSRLDVHVEIACFHGHLDLAWWLLSAPVQQDPTAFSKLLCLYDFEERDNYVRNAASYAALLQRAVALHDCSRLDAGAAGKGLSNAHGSGGSSDCGGGRSSGSSVQHALPVGMQQLDEQALATVLECADPDLLHGLLAFVECWGPMVQ